MNKTAIILVGGRGTRLGELTANTPKPLLPVAGRPFLFHVLDHLITQGVDEVILATGYLDDVFKRIVGFHYHNLKVKYSYESSPLGTGGAIAQALPATARADILVLNGDTYFPTPLLPLYALHARTKSNLSIVLREIEDTTRFGRILVNNEIVIGMREKGQRGQGIINGGIYLINREKFMADCPAEPFSLETNLLPRWIETKRVAGWISTSPFIDIGIPTDFERAQSALA